MNAWVAIRRRRCPRGVGISALFGVLLVALSLWPTPAHACTVTNWLGCVRDMEYRVGYFFAGVLWTLNRGMLIGAYLVEQWRVWSVEVVFGGLYTLITDWLDPIWLPLGVIGLAVGLAAVALAPFTTTRRWISQRHVVWWALLTPPIIAMGGQLIVEAERARMESAATFAATARELDVPIALFGPAVGDLALPTRALYPATDCGPELRHPGDLRHLDEAAAAFALADAADIWCPNLTGSNSPDIPEGLYNAVPPMAFDGSVADQLTLGEQTAAVDAIYRGNIRLLQALIPSFLALMESVLNFTFMLALEMALLCIPLASVFTILPGGMPIMIELCKRAFAIFASTATVATLIGVVFGVVEAAARHGNATVFSAVAFVGVVLTLLLFGTVAVPRLKESFAVLSSTVQAVSGLALSGVVEVSGGAIDASIDNSNDGVAQQMSGADAARDVPDMHRSPPQVRYDDDDADDDVDDATDAPDTRSGRRPSDAGAADTSAGATASDASAHAGAPRDAARADGADAHAPRPHDPAAAPDAAPARAEDLTYVSLTDYMARQPGPSAAGRKDDTP
jgi:hypothetical protein